MCIRDRSNRIGAIGVNCKILALNDRTKREGRTAFLCIYDIMKAVYQKNGENKYEYSLYGYICVCMVF